MEGNGPSEPERDPIEAGLEAAFGPAGGTERTGSGAGDSFPGRTLESPLTERSHPWADRVRFLRIFGQVYPFLNFFPAKRQTSGDSS